MEEQLTVSSITFSHAFADSYGSRTESRTISGDSTHYLVVVLKELVAFLTTVGFGVDELVAHVDVNGTAVTHSSDDADDPDYGAPADA